MKKQETSWPDPLQHEASSAGAALREYRARPIAAAAEVAAYGRVRRKLEQGPVRLRWLLAAGTVAVAMPALLWALRASPTASPPTGNHPQPSTAKPAPPARAVASVPVLPRVPVLPLGAAPTPLPTGELALADGITARLAPTASATGRLAHGILEIALATGDLDLRVRSRKPGQAVLITAGQLRFTVVGTVFSMRHQGRRVGLDVTEGLVAVSKDGDHVATVAAGESWSGALSPSEPRRPAAPSPVARRPSPQGCEAIPVSRWQERLACYKEEAKRPGPVGEHAQHALARYLRDDVVDLTSALAAFEAQRVRHPRGELRADADRAVIGLLPRLGRHAEALVESQSFLDAHPDAEDRAELRLMRGDIYRAIFGDLARAEQEYDEGTEAHGRTGDDSRFLRALCLEALGRVDEARVAYRDYLAQDGTAHAREAQRRMERLSR